MIFIPLSHFSHIHIHFAYNVTFLPHACICFEMTSEKKENDFKVSVWPDFQIHIKFTTEWKKKKVIEIFSKVKSFDHVIFCLRFIVIRCLANYFKLIPVIVKSCRQGNLFFSFQEILANNDSEGCLLFKVVISRYFRHCPSVNYNLQNI